MFASVVLALTIAAENRRPGSADWEIVRPAVHGEIEGYASRTSVNAGDPIDLFVRTLDPQFTIELFRMGWYGGAGARRVAPPIDRAATPQPMPEPDAATGLVECLWNDPYTVRTADDDGPWTTGVYLARLTGHPSGLQSYIVFVVRDDDGRAPILFRSSVTTFAAYNNWGGRSLYAFNSAGTPARIVSFDRPYANNAYGVRLDGAGDFLRRWEYNAVRFLEREGYEVAYSTDVDTHERGGLLTRHRVVLSVGHDEYWSSSMRDDLERARDAGVHLAFLGASAGYWQIRFQPNALGISDRRIVAYKEAAGDLDPLAIDGDPRNDRLISGRFRDPPIRRPENRLVGVMYAADPVKGDIVVDDADHWVFANTGLHAGDTLKGLLGSEVDAIYPGGPATLHRLAHSPFADGVDRPPRYADMTIYSAPSGAIVFAAGTLQWTWGLDSYNAPIWHARRVNDAAQRIMRNVLDRMLATETRPVTPPSAARGLLPSAIVLLASIAAAIVVLRAWIGRPGAHGDGRG